MNSGQLFNPKANFEIPVEFGTAKEVFHPEQTVLSQPHLFVVLIEDAHANPEAQSNIRSILQFLESKWKRNQTKAGKVKFLATVENATGPLNPGIFNLFPERPEIDQAVIKRLSEKGELTGAELFLLEHPAKETVAIFGAEETGLFRSSLRDFRMMLKRREETGQLLARFGRLLDQTESYYFNKTLRQFSRDRKEKNNLSVYAGMLSAWADRTLNIDLTNRMEQLRFPNLTRLLALSEDFRQFDWNRAKEDWRRLQRALTEKSHGRNEEISGLIASLNHFFEADQIDAILDSKTPVRLLLEQLVGVCRMRGVDLSAHPDVSQALAYFVLSQETEVSEFFSEIETLEAAVTEKLVTSQEERELIRLERDLTLLGNLIRGELPRNEFESYRLRKHTLHFQYLETRLRNLRGGISKHSNSSRAIFSPNEAERLHMFLRRAARFYEKARARDRVLAENAIRFTEENAPLLRDGTKSVALVAGGFHTDGIKAVFREKNIPYLIVSPKMRELPAEDFYRSAMLGTNYNTPPSKFSSVPSASQNSIFRPLLLAENSGMFPATVEAAYRSELRARFGDSAGPWLSELDQKLALSQSEPRARSELRTDAIVLGTRDESNEGPSVVSILNLDSTAVATMAHLGSNHRLKQVLGFDPDPGKKEEAIQSFPQPFRGGDVNGGFFASDERWLQRKGHDPNLYRVVEGSDVMIVNMDPIMAAEPWQKGSKIYDLVSELAKALATLGAVETKDKKEKKFRAIVFQGVIPFEERIKPFLNEVNDLLQKGLSDRGLLGRARPNFEVIYKPSFLRRDPKLEEVAKEQVVLATSTGKETYGSNFLKYLYGQEIMVTDLRTAELAPHAKTVYHEKTISLVNWFSQLLLKLAYGPAPAAGSSSGRGGDINAVALGAGKDFRIGTSYLKPGLGFGGWLKSMAELTLKQIGQWKEEKKGSQRTVFEAFESMLSGILKINDDTVKAMKWLIGHHLPAFDLSLRDSTVTILGGTNRKGSVRWDGAPSLDLIRWFFKHGVKRIVIFEKSAAVKEFDKWRKREIERAGEQNGRSPENYVAFLNDIQFVEDAEGLKKVLPGSALTVVGMDHKEVTELPPSFLKELIGERPLFDGWNIYGIRSDKTARFSFPDVRKAQLNYISMGRPPLGPKFPETLLLDSELMESVYGKAKPKEASKRVAVIGTGYVGLVLSAILSKFRHYVIGADIDAKKIAMLKNGKSPIVEPGLRKLLKQGLKNSEKGVGRLTFTTDIRAAVRESQIVFIAVGTPSDEDGSIDLRHVVASARVAGEVIRELKAANGGLIPLAERKIIVVKSTVTPEVFPEISSALAELGLELGKDYTLANNPEFLREGKAIEDMLHGRIAIGIDPRMSEEAIAYTKSALVDLYHEQFKAWEKAHNRKPGSSQPTLISSDAISTSLAKYLGNSFLASDVDFSNTMARVAKSFGASWLSLAQILAKDPDISDFWFRFAGCGFGGSCFPKDVRAIAAFAEELGLSADYLWQILWRNDQVKQVWFPKEIAEAMLGYSWDGESPPSNLLQGKQIGIWGLAFKPDTDDVREAPAFDVILTLLRAGATIVAHDPLKEARDNFLNEIQKVELLDREAAGESLDESERRQLAALKKLSLEKLDQLKKLNQCLKTKQLRVVDDRDKAARGADALVLLTEWRDRKRQNYAPKSEANPKGADFGKIQKRMRGHVFVDGRQGFYKPEDLTTHGLDYYAVARPNVMVKRSELRKNPEVRGQKSEVRRNNELLALSEAQRNEVSARGGSANALWRRSELREAKVALERLKALVMEDGLRQEFAGDEIADRLKLIENAMAIEWVYQFHIRNTKEKTGRSFEPENFPLYRNAFDIPSAHRTFSKRSRLKPMEANLIFKHGEDMRLLVRKIFGLLWNHQDMKTLTRYVRPVRDAGRFPVGHYMPHVIIETVWRALRKLETEVSAGHILSSLRTPGGRERLARYVRTTREIESATKDHLLLEIEREQLEELGAERLDAFFREGKSMLPGFRYTDNAIRMLGAPILMVPSNAASQFSYQPNVIRYGSEIVLARKPLKDQGYRYFIHSLARFSMEDSGLTLYFEDAASGERHELTFGRSELRQGNSIEHVLVRLRQNDIFQKAEENFRFSGAVSISNLDYWDAIGLDFGINKLKDPSDPSIREFLSLLPGKDASILDVGSGVGGELAVFQREGFYRFKGIDPSREAIEYAKGHLKAHPKSELVVGDFMTYDFGVEVFDGIYISDVLLYFSPEEQIKALVKAASLLKENGMLFIRWAPGQNAVEVKKKDLADGRQVKGWVFTVTPEYVQMLLDAAGFNLARSVEKKTLRINVGTPHEKDQPYLFAFARKSPFRSELRQNRPGSGEPDLRPAGAMSELRLDPASSAQRLADSEDPDRAFLDAKRSTLPAKTRSELRSYDLIQNSPNIGAWYDPAMAYAEMQISERSGGADARLFTYDVSKPGAFCGGYIKVPNLRIRLGQVVHLEYRGKKTSFPASFKLEIKGGGQILHTEIISNISPQWAKLNIPITEDYTGVDEATLVFEHDRVKPNFKGGVYLKTLKVGEPSEFPIVETQTPRAPPETGRVVEGALKTILENFGLKDARATNQEGGYSNQAWKITGADGKLYLLKRVETYRGLPPDAVAFEGKLNDFILQEVSRRSLTWTAPKVHHAHDGKSYVVHDGEYYVLYDYLEGGQFGSWGGLPLSKTSSTTKAFAELHEILSRFPLSQAKPRVRTSNAYHRFANLVERAKAIKQVLRKKNGWGIFVNKLTPAERYLYDRLDGLIKLMEGIQTALSFEQYERLPKQLVHGDLTPIHLYFEGNELAAIIDWEKTFLDARAGEFFKGVFLAYDDKTVESMVSFVAWYQVHAEKLGNALNVEELRAIPYLYLISLVSLMGSYLTESGIQKANADESKFTFYKMQLDALMGLASVDFSNFSSRIEQKTEAIKQSKSIGRSELRPDHPDLAEILPVSTGRTAEVDVRGGSPLEIGTVPDPGRRRAELRQDKSSFGQFRTAYFSMLREVQQATSLREEARAAARSFREKNKVFWAAFSFGVLAVAVFFGAVSVWAYFKSGEIWSRVKLTDLGAAITVVACGVVSAVVCGVLYVKRWFRANSRSRKLANLPESWESAKERLKELGLGVQISDFTILPAKELDARPLSISPEHLLRIVFPPGPDSAYPDTPSNWHYELWFFPGPSDSGVTIETWRVFDHGFIEQIRSTRIDLAQQVEEIDYDPHLEDWTGAGDRESFFTMTVKGESFILRNHLNKPAAVEFMMPEPKPNQPSVQVTSRSGPELGRALGSKSHVETRGPFPIPKRYSETPITIDEYVAADGKTLSVQIKMEDYPPQLDAGRHFLFCVVEKGGAQDGAVLHDWRPAGPSGEYKPQSVTFDIDPRRYHVDFTWRTRGLEGGDFRVTIRPNFWDDVRALSNFEPDFVRYPALRSQATNTSPSIAGKESLIHELDEYVEILLGEKIGPLSRRVSDILSDEEGVLVEEVLYVARYRLDQELRTLDFERLSPALTALGEAAQAGRLHWKSSRVTIDYANRQAGKRVFEERDGLVLEDDGSVSEAKVAIKVALAGKSPIRIFLSENVKGVPLEIPYHGFSLDERESTIVEKMLSITHFPMSSDENLGQDGLSRAEMRAGETELTSEEVLAALTGKPEEAEVRRRLSDVAERISGAWRDEQASGSSTVYDMLERLIEEKRIKTDEVLKLKQLGLDEEIGMKLLASVWRLEMNEALAQPEALNKFLEIVQAVPSELVGNFGRFFSTFLFVHYSLYVFRRPWPAEFPKKEDVLGVYRRFLLENHPERLKGFEAYLQEMIEHTTTINKTIHFEKMVEDSLPPDVQEEMNRLQGQTPDVKAAVVSLRELMDTGSYEEAVRQYGEDAAVIGGYFRSLKGHKNITRQLFSLRGAGLEDNTYRHQLFLFFLEYLNKLDEALILDIVKRGVEERIAAIRALRFEFRSSEILSSEEGLPEEAVDSFARTRDLETIRSLSELQGGKFFVIISLLQRLEKLSRSELRASARAQVTERKWESVSFRLPIGEGMFLIVRQVPIEAKNSKRASYRYELVIPAVVPYVGRRIQTLRWKKGEPLRFVFYSEELAPDKEWHFLVDDLRAPSKGGMTRAEVSFEEVVRPSDEPVMRFLYDETVKAIFDNPHIRAIQIRVLGRMISMSYRDASGAEIGEITNPIEISWARDLFDLIKYESGLSVHEGQATNPRPRGLLEISGIQFDVEVFEDPLSDLHEQIQLTVKTQNRSELRAKAGGEKRTSKPKTKVKVSRDIPEDILRAVQDAAKKVRDYKNDPPRRALARKDYVAEVEKLREYHEKLGRKESGEGVAVEKRIVAVRVYFVNDIQAGDWVIIPGGELVQVVREKTYADKRVGWFVKELAGVEDQETEIDPDDFKSMEHVALRYQEERPAGKVAKKGSPRKVTKAKRSASSELKQEEQRKVGSGSVERGGNQQANLNASKIRSELRSAERPVRHGGQGALAPGRKALIVAKRDSPSKTGTVPNPFRSELRSKEKFNTLYVGRGITFSELLQKVFNLIPARSYYYQEVLVRLRKPGSETEEEIRRFRFESGRGEDDIEASLRDRVSDVVWVTILPGREMGVDLADYPAIGRAIRFESVERVRGEVNTERAFNELAEKIRQQDDSTPLNQVLRSERLSLYSAEDRIVEELKAKLESLIRDVMTITRKDQVVIRVDDPFFLRLIVERNFESQEDVFLGLGDLRISLLTPEGDVLLEHEVPVEAEGTRIEVDWREGAPGVTWHDENLTDGLTLRTTAREEIIEAVERALDRNAWYRIDIDQPPIHVGFGATTKRGNRYVNRRLGINLFIRINGGSLTVETAGSGKILVTAPIRVIRPGETNVAESQRSAPGSLGKGQGGLGKWKVPPKRSRRLRPRPFRSELRMDSWTSAQNPLGSGAARPKLREPLSASAAPMSELRQEGSAPRSYNAVQSSPQGTQPTFSSTPVNRVSTAANPVSTADSRWLTEGKPRRTASSTTANRVSTVESRSFTSVTSSRIGTTTSNTVSNFPSRFSTSVATSRVLKPSSTAQSPFLAERNVQRDHTVADFSRQVNINFMNRIVEQNTSPLRTLAASLSVSEQAELSNVLGAVKLADHFAPRRGRFQADHPGLFATLTDHVGNVDAFLVASAHASVEVPVEISAQVVKIIDATTGADSVAFEPVLEKLVQENTRLVLILSGASDESAQALRVDLNRQLTAILKVAGKSEASAQNQLTVESSSLTERELSVHIERTFLGGSIRGKTAVVSGNERVLERVRSELRFLDDLGTSEARVQSDALLRVMDAARNPRIVEGRSGIISLTTWFGEVQRREGEKKITSRSA